MYKLYLFILLIANLNAANNKYYIDQIIIEHNNKINTQEIYSILKIKKPQLFYRDEFSLKKYNREIQNITGYFKSKGFLNVNVSGNIKYLKNKYVNIYFKIKEGNEYTFHDVIVTGNKYFDKLFIKSFFIDNIKKPFNPVYIRNQLLILKKEYLKNGKLDIYIIDEILVDNNKITLRINISEGSQYRINKINISGLVNIDKKYILREITFNIKDIYNIEEIEVTRKRIFDSGLFSAVEILPKNIAVKDLVDLHINVREFKPSYVKADIGFSELSNWQNQILSPGLDIDSKWVMGNIFNTASSIIISAGVSSEINFESIYNKNNLRKGNITLTYKSPWTFSLRFPTKYNIFYEIDNDYIENLIRYGMSHQIHWQKNNKIKYEVISTYQIVNSEYEYLDYNYEPVRSIQFKIIYNNIKNILYPEKGTYININKTLFGTILGGERSFIKINADCRRYYPIFSRDVLAIRYKSGLIYNIESTDTLPSYYQYNLGGQATMRGWANETPNSEAKLIYDLINLDYRFYQGHHYLN